MRKKRLLIRIGLAAIVTALACPLLYAADSTDRQPAERAVPYQRMYVRDYQNFIGNWYEKEQPVLCALIQTSAQYDVLFHPAPIMPSRDTGKPRPFAPEASLYKSKQILVVARVMAPPWDGQLDNVFEVEKITAKNGELTFHYQFNKPKKVRTFFVKNCLAVFIPKYNYEKAAFFENGKQVGELKLSGGQWSVPRLPPTPDKSDNYKSSGKKTGRTAESLLSRAVAEAKNIKDLKDRWLTLDKIAVMCDEIGESAKALKCRRLALDAKVQSIRKERFQFYDSKILAVANVAVKFAQAGQMVKCLKSLNDACQMTKGIKLDARRVLTLAQLADSYTQVGEKGQAIKMLSEAFDELKTLKYDYKKDPAIMRWGPEIMMPSLPFLKGRKLEAHVKDCIRSEIAINYAKAGEYERALEIAKGLKGLLGRTGTLEEIACVYLDNGQYEEALNEIKGIGNKIHRGDALSRIAYKFADAGQYDYAIRSAKLITRKPLAYMVLVKIAGRQEKAGKENEAKKTFLEVLRVTQGMKGAGIDSADILLKVSSAYIKAGQTEEAIKVLHQAFQIVKRTGENFEKPSRFEAIARQGLEVNNYDLAFQVVGAVKNKHSKSTILGRAALTYAKNGEEKKADETLSRAREEARGIKDDGWRELMLKNVAGYYATVQQYQEAIRIAQSIDQNIGYRNTALENVAVKCAEGGESERAIELAKSIKGYQRTDALNRIARYLADMGDYDMAFEASKGMEHGYLAREVADILIEKYARAGRYDRVIEVSKSTRYNRDSVAYSQIALSYAEKGHLEDALENIERLSSKYMKAVTLAKIAVIYAKGPPIKTGEGAGGKPSITPKPQDSASLPEIEVTGIATGAKPIAIVNGETLREGDEIKGARVVKIDKDAVTFEYNGEIITKDLK